MTYKNKKIIAIVAKRFNGKWSYKVLFADGTIRVGIKQAVTNLTPQFPF